jgi:hypothetical protein
MRLFGAVVLLAGMVWMMVGCGGSTMTAVSNKALVLKDSDGGAEYTLSVADGGLTLAQVAGTEMTAATPKLVDGVSGVGYLVGVTDGALRLAPEASAAGGMGELGLADTVTGETYELAVVGGALLLSGDGVQ